MRECSKAFAYMNAQAVMASAIMFGHGDVVTMAVNENTIVLSSVYDYDGYVEERETDWLMGKCMCGVKHFCVHDPSIRCFSIIVTWEFNKELK